MLFGATIEMLLTLLFLVLTIITSTGKKHIMLVVRSSKNCSLVSCWFVLNILSSWAVSTLAVVEGFAQLSPFLTATDKLILLRPKQKQLSATTIPTRSFKRQNHFVVSTLRGGQQESYSEEDERTPEHQQATAVSEEPTIPTSPSKETKLSITSIPAMSTLAAALTSMGKWYAQSLDKRPIFTKSITACGIFAISDYLAQRLEKASPSDSKEQTLNWTRLLSGAAVGLLYFGPAAHYWYEMIFQLLPGTTLVSTLQKAVMGQLFFGPSFTCIFFAVSLLQAGSFSLSSWASKIRRDLPGAWLAGAGFWPLVDLVSYSIVPKNYIPLFVNLCSLVWTIYLSLVANREASKTNSA